MIICYSNNRKLTDRHSRPDFNVGLKRSELHGSFLEEAGDK
jgi:hypothetical protein